MIRLLRTYAAPVLLMAVAAAGFERAYPRDDLIRAVVAALVGGWLVGVAGGRLIPAMVTGWAHRARGAHGASSGRVPRIVAALATIVLAVAGLVLGVLIVGQRDLHLDLVPDAVTTFLVVGLPARGLDQLALVAFVVLYPAMVATTWASVSGRALTTIVVPVLTLGLIGLLVAPVGINWRVAAAMAGAAALVLMADVRNDLAALPPLIEPAVRARRQVMLVRPLAQLGLALAALAVVALLLPLPNTFDVRRYVSIDSIRVEDPNPLAVAARWRSAEDDEDEDENASEAPDAVTVDVDGAAPGRLRLAVLDDYTPTGWRQSADFAITGDTLAVDPTFPNVPPDDPDGPDGSTTTDTAAVTVRPADGLSPFQAVPTAGIPRSVERPGGVRYDAEPGILLARDRSRPVTYRTDAAPTGRPAVAVPAVAQVPDRLLSCPDSPAISAVANQLAGSSVSALERLDSIEGWLLTQRIYDPSAPGGQTVAAVEGFLGQPYARGNLEVFVTTYAVLARCAGVPVRVVVGFPVPNAGTTTYQQDDVTVWVETPLVDTGWVPLDPLPTPAEQELQAELATSPPPEPPPEPTDAGDPPELVEARSLPGASDRGPLVAGGVAAGAGVLLLGLAFIRMPGWVLRRRRRIADPTAAVHAAWESVCDALIARGVTLSGSHTPAEVGRVGADRLPVGVPWLIAGLGPLVDRARYSGRSASDEDAGLAWAYTDAILERLPTSRRSKLVAARDPRRSIRRLAALRGVGKRAEAWTSDLPDTAVLAIGEAPTDIDDIDVEARIGDGSTGTVYRAVHRPTGATVAVKVFRYGPGDPGFDQQRFDWEVRIAQSISGLPHLPEVVGAGITPVSQRPFLVSTLYEDGTLLERVRRGGPMTSAEAVGLGVDLAMALDALHQLGVIHADVKPENVFSGKRGWVLGDLGSAWLRASHGPASTLTPPYAAPEVWRGASPTPAADLYSVALTMLFACTGVVPIAGNPPAIADVTEAFPDHPVVLRALDPDPRRRPRSVADFALRLRPDQGPLAPVRIRTLSLPTPTVSHRRS